MLVLGSWVMGWLFGLLVGFLVVEVSEILVVFGGSHHTGKEREKEGKEGRGGEREWRADLVQGRCFVYMASLPLLLVLEKYLIF